MTPQLVWHGLGHSLLWQCVVVLSLVSAAVMICQLYSYERRLIPAAAGNMLLVLRLLVIGCLCVTFLEPAVTWTLQTQRDGRIVVAIDVSDSMTTADVHALPSEKLRWARALGMVNEQAAPERMAAWQTSYENQREPEWVTPQETADPERRARLSQLRKKNLEQAMEDAGQISRKEIARRLLTLTNPPLLPALEKLARVEVLVFGGKSQGATRELLPKIVATPPSSLQPATTDLTEPLTAALSGSEGETLLGVVLLTDGRDNGGHNPTGLASRMGNLQAPIFPVLLGSRLRPKDLAIGSLDYPLTVFKDDQPVLKAMLNTSGFEGQAITVKLQPAEGEPVLKTVTPAGSQVELEFPLPVSKLGRYEFTLSTDPLPGETRKDNNTRQFALTVVDDKVRVLLLEGEARWEFRYLDNALKRDTRVELQSVVFEQPYLGILDDTFFPRTLAWPIDAELEKSPLANIDLVILGDVAPQQMPPQAWQLLEKFVSEGGGTLICTAGKRHYASLAANPILQQLLPVTQLTPIETAGPAAGGSPMERGFHLQLTPEAETEAMFQLDADPATNRTVWATLPGHLWGLRGPAKPGTTVFAAPYQGQEQLGLAAERQRALIVQQYYGQGQVLWLGIDSTWRWRHLVGDRYHHRFWAQLGRWAAHNKAVAGNAFVKFGPERPDINVGENVLLRARWTPEFLKRFPQLKSRVDIFRAKDPATAKPFTSLELKPDPSRPQVHEARSMSLPAGAYRAKLAVTGGDLGSHEISAGVFVAEPKSLELSDLSGNRELLSQLAQLSGGQLILPEKAYTIPELFHGPTAVQTQREEALLWDHWLIMVAFCVLLMAEWVIRKLNGLP
ncbi:MAG: hypothetical protein V4719_17985 [Planctomycetota bacterium]